MTFFRTDENGFKTTFSIDQDNFLKKNYLKINIHKIASIFNKSECGINIRLKQLNLIIPKQLAQERKSAGMFKKGNIPPNAGKKIEDFMSVEHMAKFKAKQFKKDNIPHNSKEDFKEVKRKDSSGHYYWMIKLPENRRLVYKHIWIWEEKNGKAGKGFNIVFKNGNSLDCRIENLEKVSNAELMERNTLHRFPEELRKIIQLKGAVNRQINKIEKNGQRN